MYPVEARKNVVRYHEVAPNTAGLAQLVEQLPCKHQVEGSTPSIGTSNTRVSAKASCGPSKPCDHGSSPCTRSNLHPPVAQLDRASDYESEGYRFDSYQAGQLYSPLAQLVERCFYKANVVSSILTGTTRCPRAPIV